MPIMINRGKEMLRISPKDSKKIENSTNQGSVRKPSGIITHYAHNIDNL